MVSRILVQFNITLCYPGDKEAGHTGDVSEQPAAPINTPRVQNDEHLFNHRVLQVQ